MKIGFIGFGRMATAIFKGIVQAEISEPREMCACSGDFEKLKKKEAELGVRAYETAEEVARDANIIFVSVKPHKVQEVLDPIKGDLAGNILISIAFGKDFDFYEEILPPKTKHISIIPNTPIEVCQGLTICEDKHNLTDPEYEFVLNLLRQLGEVEVFDSKTMWLAGEVTSCGPAFAAMFIEGLGDAAAKYGLDRETAYKIASQMVAGTGRLKYQTGRSPENIRDEVCSPGGVTIKGVTALQEAGFGEVVAKAIDAIEGSK